MEFIGSTVTDEKALNKIRQFLDTNYKNLYCQRFQHFPEGGLLQQFVMADINGSGYTKEFVETYEIDIFQITDKNGTKIIPWIDSMLNDPLTTEAYENSINGVKEDLLSADDF